MTDAQSLLLDSNVWLDYFLPFREGHDKACDLVNSAIDRNVALFYSITQMPTVHYLLRLLMKRDLQQTQNQLSEKTALAIRELVWGCLQNLRELATAIGADDSDLWVAEKLHRFHDDYEDNLIEAAAIRANASYLVTNDKAFRENATVATVSVHSALLLLGE